MHKIRAIAILSNKYLSLFRAALYKKRFINLLLSIFSYLSKKNQVLGLPFVLQVEPTNRCNLNCNLCLTGLKRLKREERDLSFEDFSKIINQFEEGVIYLVLYNLGEPLLNPQIYKMIEFAKQKKIFVRLSTNGSFNDKNNARAIVDSGLDELIVSLDFVTPQEYFKWKNSDSFGNVVRNIASIVEERRNKLNPFINIQLLVTPDTEKEISEFETLVRSLDVDKGLIKKVRINFPDEKPQISLLPENPKYRRRSYQAGYKRKKCFFPWVSAVVLSDNSIVPCCFDMQGQYKFGDLSSLNFKKIWNNKNYAVFRKQILKDIDQIPLCSQCSFQGFFANFKK